MFILRAQKLVLLLWIGGIAHSKENTSNRFTQEMEMPQLL